MNLGFIHGANSSLIASYRQIWHTEKQITPKLVSLLKPRNKMK